MSAIVAAPTSPSAVIFKIESTYFPFSSGSVTSTCAPAPCSTRQKSARGAATASEASFTTAIAAPAVTTLAATGFSATNASLSGAVNPNGAATTAYFQYGVTTNYGSFSATNTLAATNITLAVANTGDRPVQVGSHFHFFEVNSALSFDRARARGFRLNIPAGNAVRFEPGDTKEVTLVALAGKREVYGLNSAVNGAL